MTTNSVTSQTASQLGHQGEPSQRRDRLADHLVANVAVVAPSTLKERLVPFRPQVQRHILAMVRDAGLVDRRSESGEEVSGSPLRCRARDRVSEVEIP